MERLRNLIDESDSDDDEYYVPRRPRWIKERTNYFNEYDDHDFAVRFRLSKEATLCLLAKLERSLEYSSNRNFPNYASTAYMMPPLEHPRLAVEHLYNESQIRTRNPVERSYGVWKRRFPVLALGMRIKLDKILNVIVATAVLHNILRRRKEQAPPDDPGLALSAPWTELLTDGQIPSIAETAFTRQYRARDVLISDYFQNLL